ncbi:peptide ligase PGM1-related protein [Streptomyces halobius]|uniref:Peptide ligase PGM1-related protein n=1 Tax=Streptomyces halobius TaxID=2879846 RepID=A0ABY4M3K9_9ACTN|nr:peptide ligase PGM1-related protein [Streptomyces halobius]UQA92344.1 peptide ligase PGM1-related protein [Streptomyces halobius]
MTAEPNGYPAQVSIESRECSPQLLERLIGATLFPERLVGSAIINTVCRAGGRLLYVTAPPMLEADQQVDYYLGLPGGGHDSGRARVHMVSLDDATSRWLSEKVLDPENPQAAQVREVIREFVDRERRNGADVRLSYFEPSKPLERFAQALGVPGNQSRSPHIPLGTKHAGRQLFTSVGIDVPAGTGPCRNTTELAEEVARMRLSGHRTVVIKLNSTAYGGGLGNALLDLGDLVPPGTHDDAALAEQVLAALPQATLVDTKITWNDFAGMIEESGAIAEEWVEGGAARSPSFQGRLTDEGGVEAVSTHDQVLSAHSQTYTGCFFPASVEYRRTLIDYGLRIGRALLEQGVDSGDYGVDFLAMRTSAGWRLLGCELNLRATGTKHAFTTVTGLLGVSATEDGRLLIDGSERAYEASDSIMDPRYVGLRPTQLIRAVAGSRLGYDPTRKKGVVLHMMSAVVRYGKFGAVCIGENQAEARALMRSLRELVNGLAEPQASNGVLIG